MEGLDTDKLTQITEYITVIQDCRQEYKPKPRSITVFDDESGKITMKKEEEPIIIVFSKPQRLLKDDQELNNKN